VPLSKHGTYVAGVIASQVDGVGASGIWPASKVVSVRAFSGGRASAWDYIQAINRCQEPAHNVKVINLSIAGVEMTNAERNQLHNKIAQARDQARINVVAAAGNSGLNDLAFPAAFLEVFSVAATDAAGTLAPFSNRGSDLDIATLGTEVCLTTASGHRIAVGTGTSYAAPIVSAALNALRSYRPDLTPDEAEQALIASARVVNGVRVLDVAQTFIDQGLGSLVAGGSGTGAAPCEVVVAAPGVGAGGSGGAAGVREEPDAEAGAEPEVVVIPAAPVAAPMVSVPLPDDRDLTAVAPDRPTLKRITFRRGRLRVAVSGRRAGDVVTFTVDRRRFVRSSSRLDVRVRRWRTVTVRLRRPGAGISPALVIRRAREFS
jgi:subtilisin family serine protease